MTLAWSGYRPGALARLLDLQISTYAARLGFGLGFETRVAADMADFLGRLDPTRDLFLLAIENDIIVGGITIDGEDAADGRAHLRWLVVAPEARGRGLGHQLMDRALAFCRDHGLRRVWLTTVAELSEAAALYRTAGFRVVSEIRGTTWGREATEQTLALDL